MIATNPRQSVASVSGRQRSRARRGTLLILVLAVLVLLVILGATYLQVARYDKLSSNVNTQNYIDQAVDASISQVASVLADDLVDYSDPGIFFRDAYEAGAADEYEDYPGTNYVASMSPMPVFSVGSQAGTAMASKGGFFDDMWLAATLPDFASDINRPRWPHITNLNGYWIQFPASAGVAVREYDVSFTDDFYHTDSSNLPGLDNANVIIASTVASEDTMLKSNVTVSGTRYLPLGADADGDGIPDSNWTRAPIGQINGREYFMAVRIVDLSSMVNINTATAVTDAAGAYSASTDRPMWDSAAELDLSRFFYSSTNAYPRFTATDIDGELQADQVARGLTIATAGDRATYADRLTNAGELARKFWPQFFVASSTYVSPYGANDERELRYRNGLNRTGFSWDLGPNYANVFRTNDAESTYQDYDNYGSMTAPSTDTQKMARYMLREPRHLVTTVSNSAILAPRFSYLLTATDIPSGDHSHLGQAFSLAPNITYAAGDPTTYPIGDPNGNTAGPKDLDSNPGRLLLRDINTLLANDRAIAAAGSATSVQAYGSLSWEIRKVVERYALDMWPRPPYLVAGRDSTTNRIAASAPSTMSANEFFANFMAAVIADYSDGEALDEDDNKLSKIGGVYGFEPLPFITEVYAQHAYTVDVGTSTATLAGGTAGTAGALYRQNMSWTRSAGDTGFAIEISNPFNFPVSLKNIKLKFFTGSPGSLVENQSADLSTLVSATTLAAHQRVIIYRNSTMGEAGSNSVNTIWNSLPADPSHGAAYNALFPGAPLERATSALTWIQDASFSIGLCASDQQSVVIAAPYSAVTICNTSSSNAVESEVPFPATLAPTISADGGFYFENATETAEPYVHPSMTGFRQVGYIGNATGLNMMAVGPDWSSTLGVTTGNAFQPGAPRCFVKAVRNPLWEYNGGANTPHPNLVSTTATELPRDNSHRTDRLGLKIKTYDGAYADLYRYDNDIAVNGPAAGVVPPADVITYPTDAQLGGSTGAPAEAPDCYRIFYHQFRFHRNDTMTTRTADLHSVGELANVAFLSPSYFDVAATAVSTRTIAQNWGLGKASGSVVFPNPGSTGIANPSGPMGDDFAAKGLAATFVKHEAPGFYLDFAYGGPWAGGTENPFAWSKSLASSNKYNNVNGWQVPGPVMLVSRLMVNSPAEDGVDGDGDGSTVDAKDLFRPGLININTVPGLLPTTTPSGADDSVNLDCHPLMELLPIPNLATRRAVVQAILRYRDDRYMLSGRPRFSNGYTVSDYASPTATPLQNWVAGIKAGYRHANSKYETSYTTAGTNATRPGIAYIGELFNCVFNATGHPGANTAALDGVKYDENVETPYDIATFQPAARIDGLALSASTFESHGVQATSLTNPERRLRYEGNDTGLSGSTPIFHDSLTGDGIIDDRRERTVWASYLGNVLTTRSDTYCAYIFVRGYDTADYSKPVEQRRVYVIFDRSNITGAAGESPRVLGTYVNE